MLKYPIVVYRITKEGRLLNPPWRCTYAAAVSDALCEIVDKLTPIGEEIAKILIVKQKCCNGAGGEDMVTAYANFFIKGRKRPDDKNEYLEIEL